MTRKVEMVGKRFKRLLVIGEAPKTKKQFEWICRCDCGNVVTVLGTNLRRGNSKSCGCLNSESPQRFQKRHGMSDTPIHSVWLGMRRRCNDQNDQAYKNYGGRGIRVCAEWESFERFYADVGDRPSPRHELDRIDNNGNYDPGNVRWATCAQQSRNRRVNRMITFNGKTQCLADWAKELGMKVPTLCVRLTKYGWSVEQALTTKPEPYRGGSTKKFQTPSHRALSVTQQGA